MWWRGMYNHQSLERTGSWQLSGASKQEWIDILFGVQMLRGSHSNPLKIQVSRRKETGPLWVTCSALACKRIGDIDGAILQNHMHWEMGYPKENHGMTTQRRQQRWCTGEHQLPVIQLHGCTEAICSDTFVTRVTGSQMLACERITWGTAATLSWASHLGFATVALG